MFTGIIEEIGTVMTVKAAKGIKQITVKAPHTAKELKIGHSIANDGACLTVTAKAKDSFTVEAIPETLKLTIAGTYKKGTSINLELPMKLSDRFHGHIVSGHVDFMGKILQLKHDGKTLIPVISFPVGMNKYFSLKGSVTINGVSLTITKLNPDSFEVNLIPHTLKVTNLGSLKKNGTVNVEVDLLARYIESLLTDKEKESNYFFLQERGFI